METEDNGMFEKFEEERAQVRQVLKEDSERAETLHKFLELISGKEKKIEQATELLVRYIEDRFYLYTTKDDLKSETWIYKNGIYIPQGRSEIKAQLRCLLQEWYSQYVFGLVMAKIEADTFIDSDKFFSNNHKEEVPVLNGILNIQTRELSRFTPDKIFFNKLPVTYDAKAVCPKIKQFVIDILAKEDDEKVFYEWGGYNLTNEYNYEKALMCVGDGRNGKDKLLELLKRLLGVENCCSIPLASLDANSFVISELFGKKANLAGEIGNQDLKDTVMFKALTGRSLVSAKRKFMRDIIFVNYAKFTFACNELPMVYDMKKGFWDRWILLEFPFTFVTQEELNATQDKTFLKLRDENIIEKITTPDELSGLLNLFLEGLGRLRQNKDFSTTSGSEEVKKRWIQKSNSCVAFCVDKIMEDFDGRITKKEFRKEYSKFCKINKIIPKSDTVIKRVLQDTYGVSEGQGAGFEGYGGERYWEGIKWKI